MPDARVPLLCRTIIYRSIFQAQLEGEEIGLTAFHLKPKDAGELSVWKTAEAAWTRLRRVKRVCSLHAGRVRTLGLEVIQDLQDAEHALILGSPSPYESDESFL